MAQAKIQTYAEFWPFYLGEHRHRSTRILHYIGTTLGLSLLIVAFLSNDWRILPAALVSSYGFAWVSHFFIEHNRPATFTYPFWSLISDFRMLAMALSFSLGPELRRAGVTT